MKPTTAPRPAGATASTIAAQLPQCAFGKCINTAAPTDLCVYRISAGEKQQDRLQRPYIKQHLGCRDAQRNWPIPFGPRIQRSVRVSVAESKGDYKVRRLGLVKFQGARSVVTPLPEFHDLGRLHPC